MIRVIQGELVPLTLQLEDGDAGKFPQAIVLEETGAAVAGSPFSLTHRGNGLYTSTALAMPDEPFLTATYVTYNDAGHATESATHLRASDVFTLVEAYGTAANLALVETEASASTREGINTAEHVTTVAAVATRSSHSALDVDTVLSAVHGAGDWIENASSAASLARILAFAAQDNVMLDGGPNAVDPVVPDYDSVGLMLKGRMRAFDTAVNRAAATPGNVTVETGELFRQLISATSTIPGRADSYASDRAL